MPADFVHRSPHYYFIWTLRPKTGFVQIDPNFPNQFISLANLESILFCFYKSLMQNAPDNPCCYFWFQWECKMSPALPFISTQQRLMKARSQLIRFIQYSLAFCLTLRGHMASWDWTHDWWSISSSLLNNVKLLLLLLLRTKEFTTDHISALWFVSDHSTSVPEGNLWWCLGSVPLQEPFQEGSSF